MAVRSPRILSICTGAGGLDLGVKLACPAARTVCYVEREAFAVAELVAAMEVACLDEAPVWSDLGSFDGTAWRGRVDWLIGGIPCQPHSTASNQRRGAEDERDLWPDAARVIREVQPSLVFLENVDGILRYYFDAIRPELQGLGYRLEAGLFSAAEVGAPHERQRFFVLGYRDGGRVNERPRGVERPLLPQGGWDEGHHGPEPPGGAMANGLGDRRGEGPQAARKRHPEPAHDGPSLAHGDGFRRSGDGLSRQRRPEALRSDPHVGDRSGERPQGRLDRKRPGEQLPEPPSTAFPPSPDDLEAWAYVLSEMPEVEPAVCREADGVAWWLDATANRTQRLRVLGNGVVPLVAAHAFRTLAARIGTGPCLS